MTLPPVNRVRPAGRRGLASPTEAAGVSCSEASHDTYRSHRDQSEGDARQAGDSRNEVSMELILRKLGEGASEADLLDAYSRLTREDIHAAMRYAGGE